MPKTKTRTAALAALCGLIGCAPYWVKNADALPLCMPVAYVPGNIDCDNDPAHFSEALGCTWRFPDCALIIVKTGTPEETACRLRHEEAHAAGWKHDQHDTYREDCGP